MENKPLPEEAATSNDQVQNTKSPPVTPSKRPTEEFITDNAAAISELHKLRAAYAAGAREIAIIPSTRDEYSHFQGELESIYNKLIAIRDYLDVPLFSIPPNQAALEKIVARVTSKRKKAAAPTENNTSDNTSNVPKSLVKRETRKRATVDEDGFRLPPKKQTANPNGKPFLFSPAAILTHPNSSAPSAPPVILSNAYEEVEEIEFDTDQAAAAVAPRVKIPPFSLSSRIRIGPTLWFLLIALPSRFKGALGSVANHPLEKAEVIADRLQKQFEPNTEAENGRFTARTQRKIKRFLDAPTCLDLEKTTPGEVQEYIKKLKINKSPGLDLITNRILKNLPLKFVLFIVMLFNLLMENCHFPKNWKTAMVVLILKPNSDGTQPQNYRPISLLRSLSKAYEFVLLNRLNQHCIARNIIIPEQHGCVTQCPTVTQLLRVTELIHHGFQNNQATGMLFVDIAKAFDKIWHDGLLSKMMRLGLSDQLIKIIHSYLNSREFRVRVENSLSTPRPILSGVPQGSLLGPKLFNLYINGIPKAAEVHLAMYADNTAIFTQNIYNCNIIERLQNYVI
ncbi:RNA-directed DNA polymerase from mobile element jockey [Trichonephila clavipes]|nr:RNA-directed DNA polymerase from mobile element jockey [Trichonephila clavipes]